MALMKQTITLDIVYEDGITPCPTEWGWHELLDLGLEETVTVKILDSTTPERISDES